jgi:hypothetical protein
MIAKHGATAAHESGHAVVSRLLGIEIIRARAREGDAGVRTRFRFGPTAAESAATLEKLALVDLAGQAAECRSLRGAEWATDEANAVSRALRIVLLRHGSEELTDALRVEAAELLASLRATVGALVEISWPAIERVAGALEAGEELAQAEIDSLIRDLPADATPDPPREAASEFENAETEVS